MRLRWVLAFVVLVIASGCTDKKKMGEDTLAYWKRMNAIIRERSPRAADDLRALPHKGVDSDAVAHARLWADFFDASARMDRSLAADEPQMDTVDAAFTKVLDEAGKLQSELEAVRVKLGQ